MKNLKYILIIVVLGAAVLLLVLFRPVARDISDNTVPTNTKTPVELCFALFSKVNERGYYDRYTLRMLLDGGDVSGELNFLPGEKDSKVGKFTGKVGAVDKIAMARTIDAWWNTFGEGIRATEQIIIVFGEGTASIGAGELVDRGDGVYVYKDPNNLQYGLKFTDISCADLTERENVDTYIRANISKLSPVSAVLGGTWYVLSATVDVNNNSGTVMYEDGHIQEKKNFTYETGINGLVNNLIIK